MTGRIPKTPAGTINDSPSVISIVNKMRKDVDVGLPNRVTMANGGRSKVDTYAQGAAYLGMKYNYFPVGDDPSSPKFAVRNMFLGKTAEERLGHRRELHRGLDRLRSEIDISGAMDATDQFNQQAFELLTSPQMHKAFDLSSEPQSLRERYGMHAWGQRALLARRLVEAGCSFVKVVMENPYISGVKYPKLGFYNWDSHAVNCDLWKARANHVNNTVRATPSTVRQARLAGASAGFVLHRRCGSRTADCEPIAILKLIDSI